MRAGGWDGLALQPPHPDPYGPVPTAPQDAGMLAAKQAAAARAGAVAAAAAEIPAEAPSPEQLEWLREEQARLKEEYAK